MADPLARAQLDEDHPGEDPTIAFYEREAETYFASTLENDLKHLYALFLRDVPDRGLILDAGSGSGRDTLAFLKSGYRVEAFDASAGLARLAERLTGNPVDVVRFEDWHGPRNRYDGVWCFASLLHVREANLPSVLRRLAAGLKAGGTLFASFKWGERAIVDDRGRHFTNVTEASARALFGAVGELEIADVWQEGGPTALGDPTTWVYVLARRRA